MVDATHEVGGGVGWGGDDNVLCTCTHGWCYAASCFLALAHMVGATQHHVSCTCTHGRCYATSCFLHLHTWSVLRTQHHVSCTCTHGRCYATPWGVWGGVGLALAHMVGATQHHVFLHLHTWSVLRNTMGWGGVGVGWGGDDNILCTCTHGWCYATSCFFLALAHMVVGATQHHVSCTCTHGRCYATSCFLHLHTCLTTIL